MDWRKVYWVKFLESSSNNFQSNEVDRWRWEHSKSICKFSEFTLQGKRKKFFFYNFQICENDKYFFTNYVGTSFHYVCCFNWNLRAALVCFVCVLIVIFIAILIRLSLNCITYFLNLTVENLLMSLHT